MPAAERFDHLKGFKFSTNATSWIRQAVARAIAEKGRMIRMPSYLLGKLTSITDAERTLRAKIGGDPSSRELARECGLSIEKVDRLRGAAQTPMSLEKSVGGEDGAELGHFIEDESVLAPDEAANVSLRNEGLRHAVGGLGERERRVLDTRYGLNGEEPLTLRDVGREFEVTPERIRQIESNALRKLRALATSTSLRDAA
jgi:RNA polymerase primary sigma factor